MVAPITAMANATERAKNATRTSILASLRLVSKKPPHKVTLGELPWISSSGAPALLNRNLGSTRTALTALRIWLDARSDLMIGRQLLRLSAPSLSSLRGRLRAVISIARQLQALKEFPGLREMRFNLNSAHQFQLHFRGAKSAHYWRVASGQLLTRSGSDDYALDRLL